MIMNEVKEMKLLLFGLGSTKAAELPSMHDGDKAKLWQKIILSSTRRL